MPMNKEVLNKISISTYHGSFNEEPPKEGDKKILAAYGSNKAHVLAKTKKLAKTYSKEHPDIDVAWKVIFNNSLRQLVNEGCYRNGKIIK